MKQSKEKKVPEYDALAFQYTDNNGAEIGAFYGAKGSAEIGAYP